MRIINSRNDKISEDENPYWVSFSDIMAGLLMIFILAIMVLLIQLMMIKASLMEIKETVAEDIQLLQQAEKTRATVLHEIVDELRRANIKVELSENDTVLRIPEDALAFESAKYELDSKEKKTVVMMIGQVVYKAISKDDRLKHFDTIFIEGHTDNAPYLNDSLKGNWGLSTFRAISVWDFWQDNIPGVSELKNISGEYLFSVSGYAHTRPRQALQDMPEQKRMNRRIDIRFTIRSPSIDDLKNIQGKFDK